MPITVLYLCIITTVVLVSYSAHLLANRGGNADAHYSPTWAVHIPEGEAVANQLASQYGFENLGSIFAEFYHFQHSHVHRRSANPANHLHSSLIDDPRVRWARQQRAKSRQKRDNTVEPEDRLTLNDPSWPEMWHLNRGNGSDMNVIPVWQDGITGKGVVVAILDDGLEWTHPDLVQNYDPSASYDTISLDDDPMPHYDDPLEPNHHGTRCAGQIAATANNALCSVGIAYGARIGGIRMLESDVTDVREALALSFNRQHIDIYSASWGPDDDGQTVEAPDELAARALAEGVRLGRGGKGNIFVWASGNGGTAHDNCNVDGYTNSVWTLSVSSATSFGRVPFYSEPCSSTLATTYSAGGGYFSRAIWTTDFHGKCTQSHSGTSASAPLAAGIVALVLEANGELTWRDVQHIVVLTSRPENLHDPTWKPNGVGRNVSHSFGYGLMDAAAMVQLARKWKTVPEQRNCTINAPELDLSIPPTAKRLISFDVQRCEGVNFLEHVQASITLSWQRRGDIEIYLTSPAGTRATLLSKRTYDNSELGFNQWVFMSVHTWGEAPLGNWVLEIRNKNTGRLLRLEPARLTQWTLIFHGTETPAQPDDPAI